MSDTKKIVGHFLADPNISLRKIAKIVGVTDRTVRRQTSPVDQKMESKVLAKIGARSSDSSSDIAKKCGISQSMVQRIKARNNLVTCVKQKRAAKTDKQFNECIKRAKKLTLILNSGKNSCLAMDDETYVKKDFT